MKKCPWCGKEYPDEVSVCAIDQNPLESCDPEPPAPASETDAVEASETLNQRDADTGVPEGFRCLGKFDPFEADSLLKQFVDGGIRFQIAKVEGQVPTGRGFRKMGLIEIYVHQDDEERAGKIFTADWKV